jgi:hypothetical protein
MTLTTGSYLARFTIAFNDHDYNIHLVYLIVNRKFLPVAKLTLPAAKKLVRCLTKNSVAASDNP